ncbi:MAG: iron chelate uptake ABC transporter family permease subunit, partial [Anaerolineae bacterium]|nr:iron chelate uptake ABC transporter family permease subunit [Anaerolineae bacterium]
MAPSEQVWGAFWSRRRWLALGAGALLLAVALGLGAARGSVAIPPGTVASMVVRRLLGQPPPEAVPASWQTILFQVRLPRVFLAALVGAALSVAGAVYQGLFHNPLADPYLVGVSSGGGLGATLAIYLGLQLSWAGLGAIPIFAFLGALAATAAIYGLARVGGKTPVTTLLLAGVAVAALLSAVTTYIWLAAANAFQAMTILSWLMGSLALANWAQVRALLPYVAIGGLVVFCGARALNVLQLDEDQAHLLGLDVERTKLVLVTANALLTAAAVAVSGIIGFVGLIVPHAVRLVWGPDHRFLLPMSALVGGSFMIAADGLARSILAPVELPVGVVTAVCGVPFFLYLLRKKKQSVF